jgi:hypothetical protein
VDLLAVLFVIFAGWMLWYGVYQGEPVLGLIGLFALLAGIVFFVLELKAWKAANKERRH